MARLRTVPLDSKTLIVTSPLKSFGDLRKVKKSKPLSRTDKKIHKNFLKIVGGTALVGGVIGGTAGLGAGIIVGGIAGKQFIKARKKQVRAFNRKRRR